MEISTLRYFLKLIIVEYTTKRFELKNKIVAMYFKKSSNSNV